MRIITSPDPLLREVCEPVEIGDKSVKRLAKQMLREMYKDDGVGLAAPQVGVLRRVVVVETEPGKVYELINPKIVSWSGEQCEVEGCLSLPKKWGRTHRPRAVVVRALDRNGQEVEYRGEDLLARAFCHEIDHLDGKLFTDPGTLVGEVEVEE